MNAPTQTITRNPSKVDDKVRATWDRRMLAFERADRAFDATNKRYARVLQLFDIDAIPKPDIKWHRLATASGRARSLVLQADDLDELLDRSLRQIQWTFPHPPECEVLFEIEKIRTYRLAIELLDAKVGMTNIDDEHDAAAKRRNAAHNDLMLAPAPDLDAVQYKLEYLFGDLTEDDDQIDPWHPKFTDSIIADVRRLNQLQKGA